MPHDGPTERHHDLTNMHHAISLDVEVAARTLTAGVSGYLTRHRYRDIDLAASRIQALTRGYAVRLEVNHIF